MLCDFKNDFYLLSRTKEKIILGTRWYNSTFQVHVICYEFVVSYSFFLVRTLPPSLPPALSSPSLPSRSLPPSRFLPPSPASLPPSHFIQARPEEATRVPQPPMPNFSSHSNSPFPLSFPLPLKTTRSPPSQTLCTQAPAATHHAQSLALSLVPL